jgi:hypothetical protein
MADVTSSNLNYIGDGNADGNIFGRSATDLIGFYGLATPIARPTITLGAGTTTTLLAADVAAIKAALVALNLVA